MRTHLQVARDAGVTGNERFGKFSFLGWGFSMRRAFSAGRFVATASALAVTAATGDAALACNPPIVINGPEAMGGITNSGSIECVVVGDGVVVDGDVTNEGTVGVASSPAETGISVHNATISGAIVNSGVIRARGAAIKVTGNSTVTGGIRNGSEGTIEARSKDGPAQDVDASGANLAGGITNSGTIIVSGGKGRAVGIAVGGTSAGKGRRPEPQQ